MTDETSQSWYVKASFGAEWGPMSFDTLREMADKGDVARDDLARCGVDAEWQSVVSVLEQAHSSKLTTDSEQETADATPINQESPNNPIEETSSVTFESESVETLRPARRRPGALPNWSSYWDPNSSATREPVAIPWFVPEPEERFSQAVATGEETSPELSELTFASTDHTPQTNDETDDAHSATSGSFAELEAWKRERSERLDRLMKIVADREATAAEAARASEAERAVALAESATDSTNSDSSAADAEHSQPSELNRAATMTPAKRQSIAKQESWEATLERWKRSLPDPKVALVLLLLPLAAWWWWPSSDAAIAESYQSMYLELLELRERPNDKTGMEDFLARSQAELDRVLPGLKKRASPAKPELQWLLWMGQDCLQTMLKQPRQADTKPEITFNKLMREWKRLHNPSFEPSEAKSADVDHSDPHERSVTREPALTKEPARDMPNEKDDAEPNK